MLITARSYRTTCSVFIALNSPWSVELSTALPSCCPLRRTPFSNVVRMRTCSLVPKPRSKTSGHVKSWVDQRRAYSSYMAGTVSSPNSDQGLCRTHHLGKLLTRSFSGQLPEYGCLLSYTRKKIRKPASQREVRRMAGPSSGYSWQFYVTLFIYTCLEPPLHYQCCFKFGCGHLYT